MSKTHELRKLTFVCFETKNIRRTASLIRSGPLVFKMRPRLLLGVIFSSNIVPLSAHIIQSSQNDPSHPLREASQTRKVEKSSNPFISELQDFVSFFFLINIISMSPSLPPLITISLNHCQRKLEAFLKDITFLANMIFW